MNRLSRVAGRFAGLTIALVKGATWPYVDLAIRLWLAKLFVGFGVGQLMHWDLTVLAARDLPFVDPVLAAYVGTGLDLICPSLLALGLMTRYAAVLLLAQALATQLLDAPFDTQLFWIALFAWYSVHGAGPVSLDGLLRSGVEDSAIPLVPRLIGISRRLRSFGSPLILLALRIWLGASLLIATLPGFTNWDPANLGRWLPLDVAGRFPTAVGLSAGMLLIMGLATPLVAVILLLALFGYSVIDPRLTDSIYLLMLFGIIAVQGPGILSLDGLTAFWAERERTRLLKGDREKLQSLPRVVIVGAGFGGLRCARGLQSARVSVTLIDRNNYHLFQPLLYQVATAALSPGDIAIPARPIFKDEPFTRLLLGTVTRIDTERRLVFMDDRQIPYDYLVLATGATHSYFGSPHWAPYAPGLKGIGDALGIRRRILAAFERAEVTSDEVERAALLTFVVVGGGPTGVELAGAIAELARFGLKREYRAFDPADARVILVQAGARVLPAFSERLSIIARRCLEGLGVEVRLNARVDQIDAAGISMQGSRILARTVLWAAGVTASPAATWLQADCDKAGRIMVTENLRVPGFPNVFAIGDTVASKAWDGKDVPGLAPAAKQGGAYVARYIGALVAGKRLPSPFAYRHLGSLATIGRKAAVADFGAVKLWGAPAWWLWGMVHLGFMLGIRNRVSTLWNWFWAYLRFGGGIRLISGD